MEAEIRYAEKTDLAGIMKLYEQLVPDDRAPEPGDLASAWERILADKETYRYFVAECGGTIVATCNVTIIPNLTRGAQPFAVIENVVTERAHRQQGFGSGVVRRAIEYAVSRHCYKVMLMSGSKRKEAHAFYRTLGFSDTEKTGFFMYLDKR